MDKKPYEDLGDHIETGTRSIAQLVDSLGSFKKILNTVFLLGSCVAIGIAGWAGYRFVEKQTEINNYLPIKQLLGKSIDGNCFFYKIDEHTYTIEYFKGYDKATDSTINIISTFHYKPKDIKFVCEYLKPIEAEKVAGESSTHSIKLTD